jgi:O-antigen/teichoic acid export membrane protein
VLRRTALDAVVTDVEGGGLSDALRYALPCYAANLAQFLNYRLDVFIVSFFWGSQAVGLYGLAVITTQLVWLIPNSAAAVLFPAIAGSRAFAQQRSGHLAQLARITLLSCALASGFLALLAGALVPLVYGESFRASVEPLLWLLPGTTAFGVAAVGAAYIAGIGKPRLNLCVSLGGLVVTLALDLALIPVAGIVGAAIASSVSYSFSAVATLWLVMRSSGLSVTDLLLPNANDVRAVVVFLRAIVDRDRSTGPAASS